MKKFLDDKRNWNLTLLSSGGLCLLFVGLAVFYGNALDEMLAEWSSRVLDIFGGFYLLLGLSTVLLLLLLAFSSLGRKKLGEGKPEYPLFSWIAMMYSTGMGAGLLLRAVQEPVHFYQFPPKENAGDEILALQYVFFHWGFTPWGFYTMFGLLVAFHLYRKKRTILSSAILEENYQKPLFTTPIDTITVISTMLGVVAAVGLGSRQALQGSSFMAGLEGFSASSALWVVWGLGALATLSAYLGVGKGIRILSNLNISLALLLLAFTITQTSLLAIGENLSLALGKYLWDFVPMSLNIGKERVGKAFLMEWTYFYWAFWLAWAPFTGVFIARISRGRSIRAFILGALLVPSLGTFLWFSVFGSKAFGLMKAMESYGGAFDSIYSGIFAFFGMLPWFPLTGWVTLVLVCTFLITSIDSAIFVLGMFTDRGKEEPSKGLRLFWGLILVLFTSAVILLGGEDLLASVSHLLMLVALPFSFMFMGMMVYFIYKVIKRVA